MTEPYGDYIDRLLRRLEEAERNAERWRRSAERWRDACAAAQAEVRRMVESCGEVVPMVTEAQRRANAKYQREKMKQINVKFSPNEYDLWEWAKAQGDNASGYIKGLIRKDKQEKG